MNTPVHREIFELRSHGHVMQDKAPQDASPAASGQPRSATGRPGDRPHKRHGSEKRQTEHVSSRIPSPLRIELDRLAAAHHNSESKEVAIAIQEHVENTLGEKFGIRVGALATEAIHTEMQKHGNREAYLAVHAYYAAEQAYIILCNILELLPGMTPELCRQYRQDAREQAHANLLKPAEEK